jgi:hypothetical protein
MESKSSKPPVVEPPEDFYDKKDDKPGDKDID